MFTNSLEKAYGAEINCRNGIEGRQDLGVKGFSTREAFVSVWPRLSVNLLKEERSEPG